MTHTIITVSGGVAEVAQGEAIIIDFDNLKDNLAGCLERHAETGVIHKDILLDPIERQWLAEHDADFLGRLAPYVEDFLDNEEE